MLGAALIAGGVVVWRDRPYVLPELAFVGVLLFVHYLYLSRRLLELRLDEVIHRTLFKTLRVPLGELGSIHYQRTVSRRGQFELVLRLKGSNRPVATLSPRAFRREDWTAFVGELERRSSLRLNVPSHREIPKPAPEPARPRDLLMVVALMGGTFLIYKMTGVYPYLEDLPAAVPFVGVAAFVVALVLLGAVRERLAAWGRQEGPFVVWLGLTGAAALVAFMAVGIMKFANGVFDKTPAHLVPFTVLRRSRPSYSLRVRPVTAADFAQEEYSIDVGWDDWDSTAKDDTVLVDLRPGFLHMPWVAGHRFPIANSR